MAEKNINQLSGHFTYGKLLKFTFPSMIMLVVTSVYCVVDGLFISNFVGKTAFAGANFIWPFLMILGSIGFMFGAGGSALIAKKMGEQRPKEANEAFSLLVYTSFVVGILLAAGGFFLVRPIAIAMGAQGQMLEDSVEYGCLYMLGVPPLLLQYEFQYLCTTAGKPKLGMYFTVAAGVANMILDALFVAILPWGLAGAAFATVISQCIGGFCPLLYFGRKNKSQLRLTKTRFNRKTLGNACFNGISELLNNISMAIVGALYNLQLLRYIGEDGIAAYGVLMYVNLIFLSLFIGYTMGVSPIVSYHFGARNPGELKSLLKKSLLLVGVSSVIMFFASEALARPLSLLFTGYDETLMAITLRGFLIYSFTFLFAGFAMLGSSFFTALNDGMTSAVISFLRTMVFQIACVMLFPLLWQEDGIWLSVSVAELLATLAAGVLLIVKRKRYTVFEGGPLVAEGELIC